MEVGGCRIEEWSLEDSEDGSLFPEPQHARRLEGSADFQGGDDCLPEDIVKTMQSKLLGTIPPNL